MTASASVRSNCVFWRGLHANRLTNMVDGIGTTYYSYDAMGLLASEDDPWANDMVSYVNLANKMRGQMQLSQPTVPAWSESYAYDAANRLSSIASPAGSFGYAYTSVGAAASPGGLISTLSFSSGAYITNMFDAMARETGAWLKNSGGSTLNSHQYVYNNGNQRTRMTATAGNYQDYTYDPVGELATATGKESEGTACLQKQLAYVYDRAGTLKYRTNNALSLAFNVDNLNHLTTASRGSGTNLSVSGTTTGSATNVTVNGLTATRYADNMFAVGDGPLASANNTFTAVAKDSYGRIDTNTVSDIDELKVVAVATMR